MTIPLRESCECQTVFCTFCLNHKVDENEPNTWQSQFPCKPHPGEAELWFSMAQFLLRRTTEDKTPRPCGNSRPMSVTQSWLLSHYPSSHWQVEFQTPPSLWPIPHNEFNFSTALLIYHTPDRIWDSTQDQPKAISFLIYILILYFYDWSPRSQLSLRSYNILVHFIRFFCLLKPCNPLVCSAAKLYADLHASTSCPKQKTLYTLLSKLIFTIQSLFRGPRSHCALDPVVPPLLSCPSLHA